jgi:hypothetical protein
VEEEEFNKWFQELPKTSKHMSEVGGTRVCRGLRYNTLSSPSSKTEVGVRDCLEAWLRRLQAFASLAQTRFWVLPFVESPRASSRAVRYSDHFLLLYYPNTSRHQI